jgi:chromosome segregation protein
LFLKRIDIYGFKTFADKTRLEFKPGVTAIVGPNGCGKSNIVDAIRWVLGETNARSLRGDVMEDIIFSGSEERKPIGFAEVGITIVNDDNLLPIEYSEVEVRRRLYRSGESEFFINKNNVRLKDIHDLFADTGIGKTAYSIMEQGNIDLILSNKPEERMIIFEEAAGITRYKNRIRDSYKKLAATDENLVRLNLVINEVEKEYKNLEKQAQKAVLYKSLRKAEIDAETVYNFTRVQELEKSLLSNDDRRGRLTTELKRLDEKIGGINGVIKSSIEKVRELESRISDVKNTIYRQEAELETIGLRISHIMERMQETDGEIAKNKRLVEQSKNRRDALVKRLQDIDRQKKEIESTIQSQDEKLNGYREEIEKLNGLIRSNTEESVQNDGKINASETELVKLRNELRGVINKLLEEIDTAKMNLAKDEKRKNELLSGITDGFQKLQTILRRHETKLNDLGYASGRSSFDSLTRSLNEETGDIQKLVQRLKSDIDSVHKIHEGLSQVLFGKESQHVKKQQIEDSIEEIRARVESLRLENTRIEERLKNTREKKEQFRGIANSIGLDLARNREKMHHLSESIQQIKGEIERAEEILHDIGFDVQSLEERKKSLQADIDTLNQNRKRVERDRTKLHETIQNENRRIDELLARVSKNEAVMESLQDKRSKVAEELDAVEIKKAELKSKIDTLRESFRERYNVSLELYEPEGVSDREELVQKRAEIKSRIEALGQVNLLAVEEFNEVKKRYEYLAEQRQDLEKAKKDLHGIVADTLDSSKELFMESFSRIKTNFNNIFQRLFNGGRTDLFLTNEANIFETGIEIIACPPGKSLKKRSLLSGGEKSLTAASLLFSIFMVKPSPFCILDEVDHDLDEENVIRFLKLLKEFTDTTQFVIITHNRRTIEFADVIYGITSEQAGVSKVVSLEMVQNAVE